MYDPPLPRLRHHTNRLRDTYLLLRVPGGDVIEVDSSSSSSTPVRVATGQRHYLSIFFIFTVDPESGRFDPDSGNMTLIWDRAD